MTDSELLEQFYIGTHVSSGKEEDMNQLTCVRVLSGVVTLANAYGETTDKSPIQRSGGPSMQKIIRFALAVAILSTVIGVGSPQEASAGEAKGAKPDPQDVHHILIVKSGTYNEGGVAQTSAVSLLYTGDKQSRENISRLLEMFPNCLSKPASDDPPIGFKMEYEVFIFIKYDNCVRLKVGSGGSLWSAGFSQFKTKGDFNEFLKVLEK